jgi:membrane protein YqaA with SNARE-associated domain
VIPFINAEVLVVAAAAALPAVGIPLVAVTSTLGQMTSKASRFGLSRWAPQRLPERARSALERSGEVIQRGGRAADTVVFASAATGLPPFYGVSLAAGAVGMRLGRFLLAGGLGRLIRFGALAWLGKTAGAGAAEAIGLSGRALLVTNAAGPR